MRHIILAFVCLATGRTNAKIQNSILSQYLNGQTLETPVPSSSILRLWKRGDSVSPSIPSSSRPILPRTKSPATSPSPRQNMPPRPLSLEARPPQDRPPEDGRVRQEVARIEQQRLIAVGMQAQVPPQSSRSPRVAPVVKSPQRTPSPPSERSRSPSPERSPSPPRQAQSPSFERSRSQSPERSSNPPRERSSSPPRRLSSPSPDRPRSPAPERTRSPSPERLERVPSPSPERPRSPSPERSLSPPREKSSSPPRERSSSPPRSPSPPRRVPSPSPERIPSPSLEQSSTPALQRLPLPMPPLRQSQSPSASQQRAVVYESETSRSISPVPTGRNPPASPKHNQSKPKDAPNRASDSSSTASTSGGSTSQKQILPGRLVRTTSSQNLGSRFSDSRFPSPVRPRIPQHAQLALAPLLERSSQEGSRETTPRSTQSARNSAEIAREGRSSPPRRLRNVSFGQNQNNPTESPSSLQEPANNTPNNRANSPSSRQRLPSGDPGANVQGAQAQQNGATDATPQTANSIHDQRLINWGRSYAFAKARPYRCAAYVLGVCSAGMLGAAVGIGNDPAHLVDHHLAVATAIGIPGLLTGVVAAGLARHEDLRDHIAAVDLTDEQARNTLPQPLTAVISSVPALRLTRPTSRTNLARLAAAGTSSATASPQNSQTLGVVPLTSPATGNSPPVAVLPVGAAITFPAGTSIVSTEPNQAITFNTPQESGPVQASTPSSSAAFGDRCKNAWDKTCQNMFSAAVKVGKTVMTRKEPEPPNPVRRR